MGLPAVLPAFHLPLVPPPTIFLNNLFAPHSVVHLPCSLSGQQLPGTVEPMSPKPVLGHSLFRKMGGQEGLSFSSSSQRLKRWKCRSFSSHELQMPRTLDHLFCISSVLPCLQTATATFKQDASRSYPCSTIPLEPLSLQTLPQRVTGCDWNLMRHACVLAPCSASLQACEMS